ncbi:MAG: aminotransferase class V-fold PLP-dependent enzyme [Desulfuromonadales bacterium]|nr:aminotransferase class V-fold PLP-dependent enzyme [Desulfuromonadales bacterium]
MNSFYLDNAATSHPKPEAVYRAVDAALRSGGSAGRGSHQQGIVADREVFATRELLAQLFGVSSSERFVFTANATQALNLALFGLLNGGDRVVTTSMEHNAVTRPLRALQDRGVEIVKVAANPHTGVVATADIQAACLATPTRLLVINHASNVFGSLQPLDDLGSWCRQQGIVLLVDGSQTAGLLPINLNELAIDLFAAPGHKGLLGPQGTGFLYVHEGIELRPLIYGGTGANSHSAQQPEMLPERFESGTFNIPGLAGLSAALRFLLETGVAQIHAREIQLVQLLINGLAQIHQVQLYGPPADQPRGSAVSFTIKGMDTATAGYLLDQRGIAVRTGLHCSPDSHRSCGTFPAGTIRVSPGFFTTAAQINYFLEQVDSLKTAF